MNDKLKEKLIQRLNEIDVVRNEKVKLKHAGAAHFYFDIKKAYGYPDVLDLMCKCIIRKIPKGVTAVAAAGYGGIPLAAAISKEYNLHLILVREEAKSHGRAVQIEGYIPSRKDSVIIVDDVFSTGKSLEKIIRVLRPSGAKIDGSIVVVKRGTGEISIPCGYVLNDGALL